MMGYNEDYINSIKQIIEELEITGNKEALNYWKHELYILTGEKYSTKYSYDIFPNFGGVWI